MPDSLQPVSLSVWDLPSYLKESYDRLVFVTHPRHLDTLDAADDRSLIVSSNWILWQEALARGAHCVHAHLGLVGWDTTEIDRNLLIQSYDWIYRDGIDRTLFHNVSLGRKFSQEVSFIIADVERLQRIFLALIQRFAPKEIVFLDCRTDHSFLDQTDRLYLARTVCSGKGVLFRDKFDPVGWDATDMPINKFVRQMQETSTLRDKVRGWARGLFGHATNIASLFLKLFSADRKTVLFLLTHLNMIPLLNSYDGKHVRPILLAKWFPYKSRPGYLARALFKGALLIHQEHPRLTPAETGDIEAIRSFFHADRASSGTIKETLVQKYVLEKVLTPDRLTEKAREVKWAEALLDKHRPDEVFSDALMNPMVKTMLEVACQRNIPTSSTLHGPFIQPSQIEIFGCDPRVKQVVGRCLTWGRAHERWLDSIGATCDHVRSGNLISGKYRKLNAKSKKLNAKSKESRTRVLILQYAVPYKDFASLTSTEYEYFIRVVRGLKAAGIAEIRIKIHPKTPKRAFYERIAKFFGLSCDIVEEGPFEKHVDWADLVIGPVHSGAMLEVIGSGKTYYPVLLDPDSSDKNYFEGSTVYSDLDKLIDAVIRGDTPQNSRKILNDFTAIDEIPDAAARTWQILSQKGKPARHC